MVLPLAFVAAVADSAALCYMHLHQGTKTDLLPDAARHNIINKVKDLVSALFEARLNLSKSNIPNIKVRPLKSPYSKL